MNLADQENAKAHTRFGTLNNIIYNRSTINPYSYSCHAHQHCQRSFACHNDEAQRCQVAADLMDTTSDHIFINFANKKATHRN